MIGTDDDTCHQKDGQQERALVQLCKENTQRPTSGSVQDTQETVHPGSMEDRYQQHHSNQPGDANLKPFWQYIYNQKNKWPWVAALGEIGKLQPGGQQKAEILSCIHCQPARGIDHSLHTCLPTTQLVIHVKGIE